jgi:hypothetical protein
MASTTTIIIANFFFIFILLSADIVGAKVGVIQIFQIVDVAQHAVDLTHQAVQNLLLLRVGDGVGRFRNDDGIRWDLGLRLALPGSLRARRGRNSLGG